MDKMKLVINGITENNEVRGPVRYIFELAASLNTDEFDVTLLAGEWQRSVYAKLEERLHVHYVDIRRDKVSRALFCCFGVPKLLRQFGAEVHHIPDTNPMPIGRYPARIVSTIHDSAEFVVPHRFSRMQAAYRRLISRWQAHASDKIITVSESSRQQLVKYLGVNPAKITVTPLGVRPLRQYQNSPPGIDEGKPYVLYVGVLENAKNVDRLVEGYAALDADMRQRFTLCLVGRKGNAYPQIATLVAQHGLEDRVRILGYVTEEKLHELYLHATVFAYLSEYEGFGLPILESMRFGIPVLAANRTSLPEVAGDAACLTETDVPSIAANLASLLNNDQLRLEMGRRGRERAAIFRWENTARQTEEVYRHALRSIS
jgi:glycosyltransferase involved in cell wall biosynthesis